MVDITKKIARCAISKFHKYIASFTIEKKTLCHKYIYNFVNNLTDEKRAVALS